MSLLLICVVPLVLVLYLLIASINHGDHLAPQAYYRRKRGGAPVYYGYPSLVPRHRRKLAIEDQDERGSSTRETRSGRRDERR